MPKTKPSTTRTRVKKLPAGQKDLSQSQKKKVKGGLLPYINPIGGIKPPITTPIGGPGITPIPRNTVGGMGRSSSYQLLDSESSAAM